MYDLRFNYVTVVLDKKDCMMEQLINDLENWTRHLYRVDKEDIVIFRGLVPKKELDHLFLLKSASPYGLGYEIYVDGVHESMYGRYEWKRKRGIA